MSIPTDDPGAPLKLPRTLLLSDLFRPCLNQVFDYAERSDYPGIEEDLEAVLGLNTGVEKEAMLEVYRRLRRYIEEGRNHVWLWYISNLAQPYRLAQLPASRLIGNPPWVVYNAMAPDRQDSFRQQAQARKLWAGRNLATQNDLAATFVATCVDYYLKPGGKFGFVLPYAALRARQWAPFRSGEWSLLATASHRANLAVLSKDAWDFIKVKAPPFPQANSSVIFGTKLNTDEQRQAKAVPLSGIQEVANAGLVNPKMPWDEVRPKLTFTPRQSRATAPSPAYANAFRNGATLFPQPLVVFEQPSSKALSKVYFRTNTGKGAWKGKERDGRIEERFVRPALFSRLLLPFGVNGYSHIIAPFSEDGRRLEPGLPQGEAAADFRLYWDNADRDWRRLSGPRPPHTLLDQVDYQGKLSSQLYVDPGAFKVVYRKSGAWLESAVVDASITVDGTLYWYSNAENRELHYLAAIFNSICLADFFNDAGRLSDRDFHSGPVRNLPIPAFDAGNEHHANLSAQSELAHRRVAALVTEAQAGHRRIKRNDVLRDREIEGIMTAIDDSVRAILPDYSSGG